MAIDGYIKKTDAVTLIVKRVPKPPYEFSRPWRNKLNMQLTRAIKKGAINQSNEALINLDDVLRYARDKFGESFFQDYPQHSINVTAQCALPSITLTPPACYAVATSDNLAECHRLIHEHCAEIYQLKEKIKGLNKVIADLQPDADRHREIQKKNRENARLPKNK